MKISFTNQKNSKHCHFFLKALHQIDKHIKESNKSVYMYVSREELRLAPSIQDMHVKKVDSDCLIVLKPEVYNLVFYEEEVRSMVFAIKSSMILKAISKNDSKVSFLGLQTNKEGSITVKYSSQNSPESPLENSVTCQIQIDGGQIDNQWPEKPLSQRENFYKVIKVCKFGSDELKCIDIKDEEQLWIELTEEGMCMRTSQRKLRREGKVALSKEKADYNYMGTKSRLLSQRFINLKASFFVSHLARCVKKKRFANLYIKNIYHRYDENVIERSYIVLETSTQFGVVYKIMSCFVAEQMDEPRVEAMQREIATRQRQQPKESYLLKSEENTQHVKSLVLNKFNQVDGEAIIAQQIYKERKPFGKIEEGEQTFTRKYNSRE